MPINISFDSNLTQNEADALRVLLGTLRPSAEAKFHVGYTDVPEDQIDAVEADIKVVLSAPPPPPPTEYNHTDDSIQAQIDDPSRQTPSADLDSDGKEWDERIHSSSRAKNGDGRWKLKRGVDKGLVAQVLGDVAIEDEADGSVTIPDLPTPPVYVTEEAPNVPTPPAAAPVPPPPPAATGLPTFPETVKIFGLLGKETYEKLLVEFGIKSVMELKDDATRERFFEHESVIKARMEKGV